jgi:hypothetical protein
LGAIVLTPPVLVIPIEACGTVWVGGETLAIAVRVTGANGNSPISGAIARISDEVSLSSREGITDANGIVVVEQRFTTHGSSTLLTHRGRVSLAGQMLEVDAKGYAPIVAALGDYFQSPWSLYGSPTPTIEVRMFTIR